MAFLLWLESTGFSTMMRESGVAFFSALTLHALGMGMVVGVHAATDLRVLGVASEVPLSLMRRFRRVELVGLAVVVASGILLLVAYPTKALTNPVFYLKLGAVAAALLAGRAMSRRYLAGELDAGPTPRRAKVLAGVSLFLWAGAITSGRLLAYTYHVLMAADLA